MKKTILALLILPTLAQARSPEIQSWAEVVPEKGYILSVDLHYEKQCSKIWTKQIEEFKKENPHIKDPNVILVHQKIKVQDCRVVLEEVPVQKVVEKTSDKKMPKWFLGVFAGGSFLAQERDDTAKSGYNLGVKIGHSFKLGENNASLALGYLENQARTVDSGPLGEYEVKTKMFLIEGVYLEQLSPSWQLGPMVTVVAGEDVSLRERDQGQKIGAYVGFDGLYKIGNHNLEVNLQQRLDDMTRFHVLINLGVRINF